MTKGNDGKSGGKAKDDPDVEDRVLSKETQDLIGRKLRQTYSGLVAEPLPPSFDRLLEQLARSGESPPEKK